MLHIKKSFFIIPILIYGLCFCTIVSAEGQPSISSSLKVDYSPWSDFSENLKNCKKSTSQLPDPAEITILKMVVDVASMQGKNVPQEEMDKLIKESMITYQINGMKESKCSLTVSKTLKNGEKDSTESRVECSVPKDELTVLSESAQKIASGNFQFSNSDPASKIMTSACKKQ
jgi:hypothetical protein